MNMTRAQSRHRISRRELPRPTERAKPQSATKLLSQTLFEAMKLLLLL